MTPTLKTNNARQSELAQLVTASRRKPTNGESPYTILLNRVREFVIERYTPADLARPTDTVRRAISEIIRGQILDYQNAAPIQGLQPLEQGGEIIVQRILSDLIGFGALDQARDLLRCLAADEADAVDVVAARRLAVDDEGRAVCLEALVAEG